MGDTAENGTGGTPPEAGLLCLIGISVLAAPSKIRNGLKLTEHIPVRAQRRSSALAGCHPVHSKCF